MPILQSVHFVQVIEFLYYQCYTKASWFLVIKKKYCIIMGFILVSSECGYDRASAHWKDYFEYIKFTHFDLTIILNFIFKYLDIVLFYFPIKALSPVHPKFHQSPQ